MSPHHDAEKRSATISTGMDTRFARSQLALSGPRPPPTWNDSKAQPSIPPVCRATRALNLTNPRCQVPLEKR
jgi:hypothetical protein